MSDTLCYKCRKAFPPGSMIASYENRSYHPDCLTCKKCNRSVSGQKFFKDENQNLICKACDSKYGPKCQRCNGSIGAGEAYKKLDGDVIYHTDCFTCSGPCRLPLGSQFYELDSGRYICVKCHDKYGVRNQYDDIPAARPATEAVRGTRPPEPRVETTSRNVYSRYENPDGGVSELSSNFSSKLTTSGDSYRDNPRYEPPRPSYKPQHDYHSPPEGHYTKERLVCEKCGHEIQEESFSVYDNRKYHKKCFACNRCKKEFKDLKFYEIDGQRVCPACEEKDTLANAKKCRKCKKPILDTILKFKNEDYHEHCLTCTSCNRKLNGISIYTNNKDQPFCTDCFTKKESKKCEKCSRPIGPGEIDYVVFEDKSYHNECFTCDSCRRQIRSNESFKKGPRNTIRCRYCGDN